MLKVRLIIFQFTAS